jgi:hypothetical protein
MVVPGLAGYYLDKYLGTRVLLTFLGFALGVTLGIWQLLQMGKPRSSDGDRPSDEP